MKKLLTLTLTAALLLSLAGCSAGGVADTVPNTPSEGPAETAAVPETPPAPTEAEVYTEPAIEDPEDGAADVLVPGKAYTVDHKIAFTDAGVTMDGTAVKEYDYTWNVDPAGDYDEVKDAPAEYYTGTEPAGDETVYVAHDIFYYPVIDADKFTLANYDGEREWVTYYQNEKYKDYLFGTLPKEGNEVPSDMMHTAEEAAENPKLHITAPGTYELSGKWQGQVWVDLGEDSFTDPTAVVTLVLNGADITCTVAPAIVFYQVYEADNAWEETDTHKDDVYLGDAGANIIMADDTANYISGTNIFRMLKTKYKDEDSTDALKVQKKLRKTDGALYSYMSMNVDGGTEGTGRLIVKSDFEGLDTELHLALNSGCIRIESDNDGINCNEDNVSAIQFNGSSVSIAAGLGPEGDGVDSNGSVLVTGGSLIACANPASDSGIDTALGLRIAGGTVVALGSDMDIRNNAKDCTQPIMALGFAGNVDGNEWLSVRDESGRDLISFCQSEHEDFTERVRSYNGAVLSSPALKQGNTYKLYLGEKLLGYSETSQATESFGGFGGGFPGDGFGGRPENLSPTDKLPDDFKGLAEIAPDPNVPELPEEMVAAEAIEGPVSMEGQRRPDDAGQPGGMPEMPADGFGGGPGRGFGRGGAGSSEIFTKFTLNNIASYFGGILAINL